MKYEGDERARWISKNQILVQVIYTAGIDEEGGVHVGRQGEYMAEGKEEEEDIQGRYSAGDEREAVR